MTAPLSHRRLANVPRKHEKQKRGLEESSLDRYTQMVMDMKRKSHISAG